MARSAERSVPLVGAEDEEMPMFDSRRGSKSIRGTGRARAMAMPLDRMVCVCFQAPTDDEHLYAPFQNREDRTSVRHRLYIVCTLKMVHILCIRVQIWEDLASERNNDLHGNDHS